MWNGIVNVQEIEVVGFGDFSHARGERQAIRRVLKERVRGDFDFVIVNARRAGIETDGVGVADEMDFMAA